MYGCGQADKTDRQAGSKWVRDGGKSVDGIRDSRRGKDSDSRVDVSRKCSVAIPKIRRGELSSPGLVWKSQSLKVGYGYLKLYFIVYTLSVLYSLYSY